MRTAWQTLQRWCGHRGFAPGVALAAAMLVGLFLWVLAQFHLPGKGFTYLITFGATTESSRLSKIRRLDYHVERSSEGYDAQYYAQIAMDPSLQNRELREAVDSLPYRARRILLPAVAWALGFGEPAAILQAYALLNAVSWLLLALLLLHWFPPRDWDRLFRWAGVLFCFGVGVSFRNALTDGPSLLLIAAAIWLIEKGRPWLATGVMAVSGLAKETNLLAAASLAPADWRDRRNWGRAVLRGVLVAVPLALWLVYIARFVGPAADVGVRNFDLPFAGYLGKWREIAGDIGELSPANLGPLWSLCMLVALTAQFLFLVLRPQWSNAWWRVGATYALLLVFLGEAVWEGFPGAASRVLLPMQLAFNILVPAGERWRALLVAGNLTLVLAPLAFTPPPGAGYTLRGESELINPPSRGMMRLDYTEGWHNVEHSGGNFWIWAAADGVLRLNNPHDRPLALRLRFGLTTLGARELRVRLNGAEVWHAALPNGSALQVSLADLVLAPGLNRLEFATDAPALRVASDPRAFTFCLHNLRLDVHRLRGSEE